MQHLFMLNPGMQQLIHQEEERPKHVEVKMVHGLKRQVNLILDTNCIFLSIGIMILFEEF